ncbi:Uncharacterised protein [uncultured archaeon]|nr:Uncharacterised protein [uncultured archaeon]
MQTETLFIRWAKAFAVYFCVVVTLYSLVEFVYTSSLFHLQMFVMGNYLPSAYVYGVALGLVLSVAHFVLGKTIRRGEERIAHEAELKAMMKRRKARKKGSKK